MLVEVATSTQAHACILYLLSEGGHLLVMDAALGLPSPIARAWARVRTNAPVPIAAAVRERRVVSLANREALAREYPSAAVALPYPFAVAATPIMDDDNVWGALLLLWPSGEATRPPDHLDILKTLCDRLATVLRRAALSGRPVMPAHRPRILTPLRPDDRAAAELDCLDRLPEGYCSLDVEGRVNLVSALAADLLMGHPAEFMGERLWEVLPWLADPAFEDRYRAALVGQQVTAFIARNPAGRHLSFQLHPGPSGITVRITPATAVPDLLRPVRAQDADDGRPAPVVALHDMLHLAATLARAVTAQEVIDLVADHVMPVYDVQAVAILTAKSGRMRVDASRGYSRQAIEEHDNRPLRANLPPGHPLSIGAPAFFSTYDELRQAYPEAIASDGMRAWAFLPLVTGRPLGMCILAYDRPHQFSEDERAALTSLAGLIAQAFERARLYDVKHQLAQSMQSSLLPRTLPGVQGLDVAARYLPATPGMEIGGDFYDLIRLDDAVAAAVVGDVQGHDVTAAALMGQVRMAIHAHASAGAEPGEVLSHTNRLLTELSPDRFTSCVYVRVDLPRRTVCVANAGHLPPLLRQPGHPAQIVSATSGLLLGIDPDAEYLTAELPLPPGSVLALYTDGLIETPGIDIGDAIAELAAGFAPPLDRPLDQLADSMIRTAEDVGHRQDDIALLLVRTEGDGPEPR